MPDRNDARDMLRREGLTSYFDALMAVDEFTRLIQKIAEKFLSDMPRHFTMQPG